MSSIKWLEQSLNQHLTFGQQMQFEELFKQAKEMHKQEIIDAFSYQWQGWYEYIDKDGRLILTNVPIHKNADEYYNSLYNIQDKFDK